MTAAKNPQARRPTSGWKRLLLGGFVAVVFIAAGGIAVFLLRPAHTSPAPPDARGDDLEPAVASAVQVVREKVIKDPHSAKSWGDLGEVFLANDLEEESRPCFAEAERLDPGDPRWPYFQAGPLLNRGEWEAALPYLQRAVDRCQAKEAAVTAPRFRLAETLLILGRFEEAEANIRLALDRQPDDPRALYDTALLAVSGQDWEAARTDLLRCLGSPFTQKKARAQLAAVCQRLGDAASAEEFRNQADRLPLDSDWVDPFVAQYLRWTVTDRNRYRRAEQLEFAGRLTEAAAILRPMAAAHPDAYLPHLTLGKVLAQTGEQREAELALRRALRLAPDKVQAHYYLALLLFNKGAALAGQGDDGRIQAEKHFQEAASLARQALTIKPDYGFAHMALGLSLMRLGQKTEALAALRQAVRSNPEFAELHYRLGEALADDSQEAEAHGRFEQALQLAPPDAPWRQEVQDRLAKWKGPGGEKPPGP
jgi:tetratricopeptide (TPR) repeat protein